jgi:pimeloyl-ACP methyl ester carboxylesterase
MSIAKVGDINLYYEVHGKGEPLVLIMGLGVSNIGWFLIRDKLASEYRVIVFDNRGTGRSDKPEMPYTTKMMAADVAGLLDVLGIGAANVFGHSMGGMIAQEFALNYPDRLNNLILGGTHCGPPKRIPPTPELMAFASDPELAKMSAADKARATIPWAWNKEYVEKNPAAIERYIALASEYPTPSHAWVSQTNVIMSHDTYDRLPDIKSQTLVIAGSQDRMIPYENSKLLASRIPNAEVAIIENAGHEYFDDSTEKSSKIILDFLRRHSKARAKN